MPVFQDERMCVMAYFANGTHGEQFADMCDNCIHGVDADGEPLPCPINFLQLEWNYSQGTNPDQKTALDLLVPQQKEFATNDAMCHFHSPIVVDVPGQQKLFATTKTNHGGGSNREKT